jgi:broad specificity phosphatase PhoE
MQTTKSYTVWVARHGERLDGVDPHWAATAERPFDPPLTPDGLQQAQQTAERLAGRGILHVFCSPFLRTLQTATAIADVLDLPIKVEHGACEWLHEDWFTAPPTFAALPHVAEAFPRVDTSYESRVVPHGLETWEQCQSRNGRMTRAVLAAFPTPILIVGHGVQMTECPRELLANPAHLSRWPLCSVTKLVRRNGRWRCPLNGDDTHLTHREQTPPQPL